MMAPMRLIRDKDEAIRFFRRRGVPGGEREDLRRIVADTLEAVRSQGDAAVRELTERFDGVRLETFEVPAKAYEEAAVLLGDALKEAIRLAIRRVRRYYRHQVEGGFLSQEDGALLGQLVRPLERVACYVPGGTAPLFSSLIMTAVPAQVAGVPKVVVATPPREDGGVAAEILFTARELGLTTVYLMGGAQAIAALAYGTESIPRVDKIVGPGNRFVMLAKQMVFGEVGIEALPGPTETLVLADDSARVDAVVADLLAQAEHDQAQPVLVTTSAALAEGVVKALPAALEGLSTALSAGASLEERGVAVVLGDLDSAMEVVNAYAPEHLCLLLADPWQVLDRVRNAGGVFLGEYSLEALGDYLVGPSHVMPTGGTARFSSFVNLRDFQKVMPLISVGLELVEKIGPPAARMARAEGLEAHARAIELRLRRES